jgi:uncharacterized membrane protein
MIPPDRARYFGILAGLQVAVVGAVFTVYAWQTNRGASDELGGVVLCGIGLVGAWFFRRR